MNLSAFPDKKGVWVADLNADGIDDFIIGA